MKRSSILAPAPSASAADPSTIRLPAEEPSSAVASSPLDGSSPAIASSTGRPPVDTATVAATATAAATVGPGLVTTDGSTGGRLRIHEASELVGLTPRSIRYYEEVGLLRPSARSQGAYRLYDESDIERLRFIKGLRDDAGFSLAEIGRLLEAESGRQRAREAFAATTDPAEQREILAAAIALIDAQVATLEEKIGRLHAMVDDAQRRRAGLETLMAGLGDAR